MCHFIANADTRSSHEEAFCSSGFLKSSHQGQHIAPPSVVFEHSDTQSASQSARGVDTASEPGFKHQLSQVFFIVVPCALFLE